MAAQGRQRTLIPRGAPASAIPCHKFSELAKMDGVAPQKKEQCDSGFGDDEELRSERLQSDGEVRSLEQTTQNLSIEDPSERPDERQPSSLEQEDGRTETAHTGGHFLNFAQCNDVRYLLAPVREGLFLQDQDGDTPLHLAVIHMQQPVVRAIISLAPCKECLEIYNDLRQTPLHLAVITRQPVVVQMLVSAGVQVDLQDRNGKTALHLACERGNIECVQEITRPLVDTHFSEEARERALDMLDARNFEGFTALQLAVLSDYAPVVGYLAQLGANVNAQDSKSGRTALHHAVEAGNLGMTGYLIFKCKAEVDAMNFDECTPLHTAAGRGMESMVAMLLAAGADPKVTNFEGESPRDHAHSEVFEMLC